MTHTHRLRLGMALLAGWALTGCALPPKPSADLAPGQEAWSGRLALRVDSTPVQHLSAGFELSGNPAEGELRLLSPLGQVLASAHWTPHRAWLQRGNDRRDYPDTTALTSELTGTALPLPPLFAWLRGQAEPVPGWQVDLSQHAQGRLSAQRLQPEPTVQLRLVFQ